MGWNVGEGGIVCVSEISICGCWRGFMIRRDMCDGMKKVLCYYFIVVFVFS